MIYGMIRAIEDLTEQFTQVIAKIEQSSRRISGKMKL
jgi:hypothetical protein